MQNHEVDPYSTPKAHNKVNRSTSECPICLRQMERGFFRSSGDVRWFGENSSAMKNFVSGGVKLPHKKEAISLGRKYPGYFCAGCMLTILDTNL